MKHALWALLLLVSATQASAADLPCAPGDPEAIALDGLTDDWSDLEGVEVGGGDRDLSFTLKCSAEPGALLFLVDVHDDAFVRTKGARPGEDHVVLTLGGHPLLLFPGDARSLPTLARFGKRPAKRIRAVSALQERGWAIELRVPLSALPGYKQGLPLDYRIAVADCDSKVKLTSERSLEAQGSVRFASGGDALPAFLSDRSLRQGDVWFDRGLSLGKREGARVVLAGRYLAVLRDGYAYLEMPYAARGDVKSVQLLDLAGDSRQAIVVRYVERGGDGTREVLACYRPFGDTEIRRVFAAEVGKTTATGRIENRVSWVKHGRATDLVLDAGQASGLSAESWHEAPATDLVPILLPWSADRHARYRFSGDEYRRAQ